MRALLDVNVLLALFDPAHVFNATARDWWAANQAHGWASCPLTQNGFVRVSTQRGYARPLPVSIALAVLAAQMARSDHAFWPDAISITDEVALDRSRILGPRQITDVYLLALAVKNGGRLVTFDRGVPLRAVHGAEARHLVAI